MTKVISFFLNSIIFADIPWKQRELTSLIYQSKSRTYGSDKGFVISSSLP
jgi:hypothetical protein